MNKDVSSVTDGKLNVKKKAKLFAHRGDTSAPWIYSRNRPTVAWSKIWGRAKKKGGGTAPPP